tara:strand:+ start:4162 stop:4845 length:684 start_codon:yes stop_codon:yes gene_type:complete
MEEQQLFNKMKEIEAEYLKPHDFAKFNNYWLPREVVEQSTNVLSYGVHRDVGFEQEMCELNPNLNIHLYDPTPDTIKMWEGNFPHKDKMTYHQKAYAHFTGEMNFYYNKNDLTKCYSLLPLPQLGDGADFITVDTINLADSLNDVDGKVDIMKADIEGVWYDFCREVLDLKVDFKALAIEFEVKLINNDLSIKNYEELLKEFKSKGYDLYLNRPRNKILSEAIILKK